LLFVPRAPLSVSRQVRLGTILALLVLVTTVPLGLFAAHLIYTFWQQQQGLVNRQNIERARAVTAAIDQEVQSTVAQLRVLAALEPIETEDLQSFYGFASRMVDLLPGWEAVRLLDPSLAVLMDTSVPFGRPSAALEDGWARQVRDTKRVAVSTAARHPDTGQLYVSIGVPVISRERLRFILGARVLVSEFSQVVRRQKSPPDGVVSLMDSKLTIIARTRGEEKYLGGQPSEQFANAIRGMPEGTVRSRLLEGTPSYSAHSTSALTGWTIGLGVPADAVDGPLWRSLGLLVTMMMTLLGSGLIMAFLVRRRIVRAQVAAVAAARALARGEPVSLSRSTVAEFNDLANGLRDAAAILGRRLQERDKAEADRATAAADLERALAREQAARAAGERNEARLSVTLRSIGEAVIATDPAGLITILNPVAQSLTGWRESEAIGHHFDRVFETVDERTRRPNPSPIARVLAAESSEGVSLPSYAVLLARDGRDIPIGDSAAAIRTPDGTLLGIVVVFRDMSAERDAEQQRAAALKREQAARRAAESLSRAKDEFVATVSHELRTPLNAIYGWVAMLKMGSLDAAGQAKALDVIDRNTRVQAQLIEDLLDMARVIRGTVRLEMQPLDLAAVIESALDAVKPASDARRVTITVDAPRGLTVVSGDSSRLQQIVWNLLSNAIKFSESGDEVTVNLGIEGDDAVLTVSDTGTGIDPAFLPHVFDRFRQESSDVTREHAGLGLGLSLVRHLAELHGGTVSAESRGKSRGARFTVRLPLIGARAGLPLALDASEISPATDMKPAALTNVNVLIVDDDPDARELVATVLQQASARVRSAHSVREALELLQSERPDIVITDIAMPHATGFDLVKLMREDPRSSEIPVVAVTAYARAEDRAQALALGFHAHVGKPFSPRALVAVVAELARR
jgi:PAS domain S-box-containing protein